MKATIFALFFILALAGMTKYTEANTLVTSWYDCATPGQCSKSKRTASGEKFNPNAFTAAHPTYKFGTKLRVTYKGKSVIVRVNDRGPFIKGRHLDLSRAAARAINCPGVCKVKVEKIG